MVSTVGRELYEKFFRGYTRKQWGLDPSELDKSVTARVPTRTNRDDRYFTDTYPVHAGRTATRRCSSGCSTTPTSRLLDVDYDEVRATRLRRLIFTGPIDEYFDYRYGKLPYRSLRFEHVTLDQEWHPAVGVVNYPKPRTYTRVTEYKHLTGQEHPKTSVTYEYPSDDGDPYYPVPRPENKRSTSGTRRWPATPGVYFVGRLATYRYYNMDQVVGQALATFRRINEAIPVADGRKLALAS